VSKKRIGLVSLVGFVLAVAYVLRILIPQGLDPTALVAFGEQSPVEAQYAERMLGRPVILRTDFGHDGKFFFAQANDPWLRHPETHAAVLDRPVYRSQRMLYPALAGGLGLFQPGQVVWGLLGVNLVAVGLGTMATALLATRYGISPWWGLAFPLNLGVLAELDVDAAGVVALALGMWALVAFSYNQEWAAAFLLAGAALSREVMLAFAGGLVVGWWVKGRRFVWKLLALPLLAWGGWYAYISVRLSGFPPEDRREFARYPFQGLVDGIAYWRSEPLNLLIVVVLLGVFVLFLRRALKSDLPLAWAAMPFVLVAVLLSVYVWRQPYDITRAVTPVLTAYPLLLAAGTRSADAEHAFG
jgi:hypothetical protein